MSFFSLPLEILKYIFDKITIKERSRCRLLCSYFKNALDRDCMWDDIKINDCGLIRKKSFSWLSNNTKLLKDPNNFKLLCTQLLIVVEDIDMMFPINSFVENQVFDKYYANTLFQHHIRYGNLNELQVFDAIIRKKYPDLIEFNKEFIAANYLNRKFGDDSIEWIIKTYLSDYIWTSDHGYDSNGNYVYRPDQLGGQIVEFHVTKLLKNGYMDSARLLLSLYKRNISNSVFVQSLVKKCYYDNMRMLFIIDILGLNKPGSELAFSEIFQEDPKSLLWLWSRIDILPGREMIWNHQEYIIRSATFAHTMIEFNSNFDRIKWVVRQFDPVLRIVSRNDETVRRYIETVRICYKIPDPEVGETTIENLQRIPYYIRAGNPDKLKYMLNYVNIEISDVLKYLLEWMKLSKKYPSEIFMTVGNKLLSILDEINEKGCQESFDTADLDKLLTLLRKEEK
jgi:hypothetical protein